jgi:metallo-beta-lactamase class B
MRGYLLPALCGVLLCATGMVTDGNGQGADVEPHREAARTALQPAEEKPLQPFHVFDRLYDQMCAEPTLPDQMRQGDRTVPEPRDAWYVPPADLFDNLYFIGTQTNGVYAVNTSEGIILIDTGFHYNSEELVLGLLKFGVDPDNLRYIVVSHAHDDRYFGASVLQKAYPSARVVMSEADWDVVAQDNNPTELKPIKDMVVADGERLTLGEVTITFYITPGHTPGTLSMIIEPLWNKLTVNSDDDRHVAAFWGGTDITIGRQGVQYFPDGVTMMNTWVQSARRFRNIAAAAGADTILTQTLRHGNMREKMRTWRLMNPDQSNGVIEAIRLAGEPHALVNRGAVDRYFTVLLECYEAQRAWRN